LEEDEEKEVFEFCKTHLTVEEEWYCVVKWHTLLLKIANFVNLATHYCILINTVQHKITHF
jgi:hypothetical protein